MSKERKSTPQAAPQSGTSAGGSQEIASELRRFARALAGPLSTRVAETMVQAATTRIAGAERIAGAPRERAFAEIVRLNRRRVRERAPEAAENTGGAHNTGGARNMGGAQGERREQGERPDHEISRQIAAMPLDEREALLTIALAGYGYEAAARILDLPIASVLSRLIRARARLDGAGANADGGPAPRGGHLRVVK
ncbi:MAG: sigma factor-like helix-turn-helix DNA-binding protein [Rhodoblastus sp.]